MESTQVIISGGGPNGLMLACELSLAGVRPVLLEQHPRRLDIHKANGLIGQVVRLLDHRGLYQRYRGNQEAPQPFPRHLFGGFPLDLSAV
ncbi:MAG: FAD-dependent oxidoreductase, partial [Stackebrandtia sp.]